MSTLLTNRPNGPNWPNGRSLLFGKAQDDYVRAMTDRLVSTGELAKALGVSRSSIARYVARGYMEPVITTAGGQYRWNIQNARDQVREYHQRQPDQR